MNSLILVSLATFGLSALISNYDGPFDVFARLRGRFKLLRCTVCLSVWLCLPVLILQAFGETTIVGAFATIGSVIIIERLT